MRPDFTCLWAESLSTWWRGYEELWILGLDSRDKLAQEPLLSL